MRQVQIPMSRHITLTLMALLIVFTHSLQAEAPAPGVPQGFTPLFNGEDLTGWKGLVANPLKREQMNDEQLAQAQREADESMLAHWRVVDGALEFDGQGENLCTARDYGDFELYVDWKILPAGDSGLYVRGNPQIQIWDTGHEPLFKHGADQGSGGLWNNKDNPRFPLAKADNPVGEWNTFFIRMVGNRVTVKLNGQLVVDNVELENYWEPGKPLPPTGQIELQSHGNKLWFRNIYIRELNDKDDPGVTDDAVTPTDGVIKLFNGENLDGLYTWLKDEQYEDPRDVFRVTDGMLHVTGDGFGGILTRQAYENYHMVLEFKWGERTWRERSQAARDSGLLLHSTGADGGYNGTWMPAIEVQIIEGGVGDLIMVSGNSEDGSPVPIAITCETSKDRDGEIIWQAGAPRQTFDRDHYKRVNWFGRDPDWEDKLGFRGSKDPDSPVGDWTRLDVTCDGGHIQVYVNGTKVNEAFDVTPRRGKLQLQTELAEVYFRRWELWPLDQAPEPGPAN